MALDISVIFVTYNPRPIFHEAVEAILKQRLEKMSFEVIITDDASEKGLVERVLADLLPQVRLLSLEENRGQSRNRNVGAAVSQGRLLVFLDDDIVVHTPDFLALHYQMHQQMSMVDIAVVSPIAIPKYITQKNPLADYRNSRENISSLYHHGDRIPFRFFLSGCFSMQRETFNKIKGFDEAFQKYGLEDLDFAYRLHCAGGQVIYCTQTAAAHHDRSRTVEEMWRIVSEYSRVNMPIILRKNPLMVAHLPGYKILEQISLSGCVPRILVHFSGRLLVSLSHYVVPVMLRRLAIRLALALGYIEGALLRQPTETCTDHPLALKPSEKSKQE